MKKSILDYLNGQEIKNLTLNQLARIIVSNWKETSKNGVYFGAVPYLQAMASMNNVNDNYGMDSGKSIVNYFLANSSTWRGEVAKAIKLELKNRIK